jgi:hypothetical protein
MQDTEDQSRHGTASGVCRHIEEHLGQLRAMGDNMGNVESLTNVLRLCGISPGFAMNADAIASPLKANILAVVSAASTYLSERSIRTAVDVRTLACTPPPLIDSQSLSGVKPSSATHFHSSIALDHLTTSQKSVAVGLCAGVSPD